MSSRGRYLLHADFTGPPHVDVIVPWDWICSSMAARAPEPSEIMAITLATPMITPSMVRTDRTALRRMASTARRTTLASFT